jgi:hypothetical protein
MDLKADLDVWLFPRGRPSGPSRDYAIQTEGALVGGILLSRSSTLVTLLPLVAVALVVVNGSVRYRHSKLTGGRRSTPPAGVAVD